MNQINNNDHLIHNPESIFRQEEDGAFLFHPETGNLKYINQMGVILYQLLDGAMSTSDIIATLKEKYADIPGEQIEKDVKKFLADLVEMEFLIKKV